MLFVVEQRREPQSALTPHALPRTQLGVQLGVAQALLVHTRDPQSPLAPQAVPCVQFGAQASALHAPFTHERVAHWLLLVQAVPSGQLELPPQLTEQLAPV